MKTNQNNDCHPSQLFFNDAYHQTGNLESAALSVVEPIMRAAKLALITKERIAIAISGGSATGKTAFFTPAIARSFDSVQVISADDYCVGNSVSARMHGKPNLYVPEDFDPELLARHVEHLKLGKVIDKPVYSYEARERVGNIRLNTAQLLIVEGEFLLHPPLADQFDVKVFVSTDDHSRFVRRMIRQRRNPNQTDWARIEEYFEYAFPFYHSHLEPTRVNADMIIHNHYEPSEGLDRIEQHDHELVFVGDDLQSILNAHSIKIRRQFIRRYYVHPQCTDGELLYTVFNDSNENSFRYSPGRLEFEQGVVRPFVHFDIGDGALDLNDIGYNPLDQRKGEEWLLHGPEGVVIRCVKVDDGRSAVHISAKRTDHPSMHSLKESIEAMGWNSLSTGFDKWLMA